jgi:hypothetical protein
LFDSSFWSYISPQILQITQILLRVVDAISQIYYWITAANAAMMKPLRICELSNNRGDSR